jgi:hypothetical protein
MKPLKNLFFFLVIATSASEVFSNEGQIYIGTGSNSEDIASSTAWTIGFIGTSGNNNWGLDLSGEGYSLDSTYNQDEAITSALSVNALWGKPVSENLIVMGLLGFRDDSQECSAQSYIGYQCYADAEPDASYAINYGIHMIYTFESYSLGFRATGESQQFTLGFNY